MSALAIRDTNPSVDPLDRTRYPDLVSEVALWDVFQETRIKMQLPILAFLRGVGAIEVGEKVDPAKLMPLCIEHHAPPQLADILTLIDQAEHQAELRILRTWRKHPLAGWAKEIHGLGEHSCAVLVAYLDGDPYIAYPKRRVGEKGKSLIVEDEPFARSVGQLWAYCGVGDSMRKRAKGMSQDDALAAGKPRLKSRVRLISESFLKTGNREIYDEGREIYAERVHERACAQCKAKPGDEWRDGHKHAAALRLVGKRFLVDLWEASRDSDW